MTFEEAKQHKENLGATKFIFVTPLKDHDLTKYLENFYSKRGKGITDEVARLFSSNNEYMVCELKDNGQTILGYNILKM